MHQWPRRRSWMPDIPAFSYCFLRLPISTVPKHHGLHDLLRNQYLLPGPFVFFCTFWCREPPGVRQPLHKHRISALRPLRPDCFAPWRLPLHSKLCGLRYLNPRRHAAGGDPIPVSGRAFVSLYVFIYSLIDRSDRADAGQRIMGNIQIVSCNLLTKPIPLSPLPLFSFSAVLYVVM